MGSLSTTLAREGELLCLQATPPEGPNFQLFKQRALVPQQSSPMSQALLAWLAARLATIESRPF